MTEERALSQNSVEELLTQIRAKMGEKHPPIRREIHFICLRHNLLLETERCPRCQPPLPNLATQAQLDEILAEANDGAGDTIIGHEFEIGDPPHRCARCGWPRSNHQ